MINLLDLSARLKLSIGLAAAVDLLGYSESTNAEGMMNAV